MGPSAGLDEMMKRKFFTLPGLELRLLGRPARRQWLYRLRYPGSSNNNNIENHALDLYFEGVLFECPPPGTPGI
jgi:hypothetical protein